MGNPKNDSGEKNNSSSGSPSNSGAASSAQSKENLAKLPPAGFIYSDDENLMDELSMGWGLTANDEQDELDAIINKTVDMSKVSNTKLKALSEPPKSGVERIERVRAERASREITQPGEEEKSEREAALKRAKQAAAEREEAAKAAAQREKAERALAERQEAERQAALEQRAIEEAEAKERSEREQREREEREEAERARVELEKRELAEQREAEKQAREKAARDAAEREEAEREIVERERLQKEAAAKLRAKQEQAKREAEEATEQERLEQERLEQERIENEKQQEADRSEKESATKPGASKAGSLFGNVLSKGQIKVQKIGPKGDDRKKTTEPTAKDVESKKNEPETSKPAKPSSDQTNTTKTAKLSRTPEEELAALLAEEGENQEAPVEPAKPIKKPDVAEGKVSRSGLTALEPTDDTPLTGVLKAIKPDAAKLAGKGAKAELETTDESDEKELKSLEKHVTSSDDTSKVVPEAKEEQEDVGTATDNEIADAQETSVVSEAEEAKEFEAEAEISEEATEVATAEKADAEPTGSVVENAISDPADTQEDAVTEISKTDEKPLAGPAKDEKLDGVDKFYKPERVKLSDFVRRTKTDPESKPASKFTSSAEKAAAAALDKERDTESADLPSDNLPAPLVAQTELSNDIAAQAKNDIRESVKQESPEKKAAIIAALKKLEDQVDESNLDSLSTDSLKDVLSKLPDMSAEPQSAPGKADGVRKRPPSPAMARLAAKEEPSPDRDLAREKLKVMQKMAHTLPVVKSYLPHKRALLIMVAVVILCSLAAVAVVRGETIAAREALKKKDYSGALNALGLVLTLYPFSAEAHQLRGSALYLSGDLKDAYTEYDTALNLNPGMKDALARRAAVSYQLGNYSQSVADYEKLLQQEGGESQSFDRLLSLANAYLGVGDVQKANDMFNRCLDKKPNHAPAIAGKIAVSVEKKLYERATMEANKALASNPGSDEILVLRARAYTGLHNFPLAEKDLAAALKKNPKSATAYAARANLKLAQKKESEAYASFDKAIKLNPKDATFILDRAAAYINNGKFDLAAKDIQKAKSVMGTQQTARLYVLNTQVLIANKQAQKALEELKTAQEKFPKNQDIILAQADALAASGKLSDGIVACEKAMEMDKNDVDAILKHGLLSVKFGNKMRAAEDFAQVIRLDPRNVMAYKTRGMMYFQQEKYASAQEDLNKVIALDPSQTDAQATLSKAKNLFAKLTRVRTQTYQREGPSDAYLAGLASKDFETLLNDGFAAYKRGDVLTAVPTLEQAVKVNPRDARARRYLAYAYKSADQLGEAASQFDALYPVGALGPQDTLIYIEMLTGSGQSEKAAKVIEETIAKQPGNQALYLQLANSQANAGEIPKAVQTCNKGIAINPRTAIAQELISLRNNLLSGGSPNKSEPDGEKPGA